MPLNCREENLVVSEFTVWLEHSSEMEGENLIVSEFTVWLERASEIMGKHCSVQNHSMNMPLESLWCPRSQYDYNMPLK